MHSRVVPSLRPRGFLLDLWPDFLCGLFVHARLTAAPTVVSAAAMRIGRTTRMRDKPAAINAVSSGDMGMLW